MPDREVVFFAPGIETTIPLTAMTVLEAERLGGGTFGIEPCEFIAGACRRPLVISGFDRCAHPLGRRAATVGEVLATGAGRDTIVTLRSVFGGERVVDLLQGEQLPRIC